MGHTLTQKPQYAFQAPLRRLRLVDWQGQAPTILLAVSTSLFLGAWRSSVVILLVPLATACLVIAFVLSHPRIPNKRTFSLLIGLNLLLSLGAIGANIWGAGYHDDSLVLAIWGWLMLLVYCTPVTKQLWGWITLGIIPHLAIILYQGITHLNQPSYRATGVTFNADIAAQSDLAAGIMSIGIVHLLLTRRWFLTPPFFLGILFTQTRLAFWVTVALCVLMAIKRVMKGRHIALLSVGIALVLFGIFPIGVRMYTFIPKLNQETNQRISPPGLADHGTLVGLLPQGYSGDIGAHSAPVRLFYQLGILGLIAWAWLSLSVVRNPSNDSRWWVMLLLLGLSTLDYYTVMVPFSMLWWLALK